ncbi:uncharacterized protein [Temnothorax longispinosus]|uniref:uncharacterized protein n=1 Tax=Temnothorax longispinosus TaxID=300112 RepID=UPI003A99EFFB
MTCTLRPCATAARVARLQAPKVVLRRLSENAVRLLARPAEPDNAAVPIAEAAEEPGPAREATHSGRNPEKMDNNRTCYDKHAPYRVICPKHLPAPWLTPDLRKLMKDRDRTRRVWRRNKTESNYDTYRRLRNLVQLEVRRAKTEYFHKTFYDAKEPNILWKKLRHFGFLRPKAQHDRLVFTPEELNACFTGHAKDSDPEESIVFDLGEVAYSDQKFYWNNIEPGEIVRALQRSNSEATGRDELPRSLIVRALPCILPALTHIFNYCLSYGVYPSVWRSAVICPIPKVNHPCELHDYKPISILCAVSKALERIVADQITNFLEENDILDPFQSAYRKDFSTQTALIRILDDIRLAVDRRKVTIAVLFDFSKAFDNPGLLADAIVRINEDIKIVVQWATENGLKINPKKTQAIIVGTLRYISSLESDALPSIYVNDSIIPFSDSVEYLGVTLICSLSWERQISKTIMRVNSALYQLKLCKHLLPLPFRIMLVSALIVPILDYGCTILTNITGEQNLRLQRAYNRCVRFIFQAKWDEHITPYFDRLGWLKISFRRLYFVGSLTFSVLAKKKPEVIFSNFVFKHDRVTREIRAPLGTLILPQCRTEFYKRSFCSSAAELWNGIPPNIRNASSLPVFKSKLYNHLLAMSGRTHG